MKYIFSFLIAILAFSACEKNGNLNCESVKYDEVFIVEAGKSYCFSDGVKITVDSLINAYCPCFVDCIWGGEAQIHMTIVQADATINYIFHEEMENDSLDRIAIEAFEFEQGSECTRLNPSPKIVSAELKVRKL